MVRNPVMLVVYAFRGRRRPQNVTLRQTRKTTLAKVLWEPRRGATWTPIASTDLVRGDIVLVEAGDIIPGDGEVLEGTALVDEASVTGAIAPVIRESGGDSNSVMGGSQVLSDWIVVRMTANPGDDAEDQAAVDP